MGNRKDNFPDLDDRDIPALLYRPPVRDVRRCALIHAVRSAGRPNFGYTSFINYL